MQFNTLGLNVVNNEPQWCRAYAREHAQSVTSRSGERVSSRRRRGAAVFLCFISDGGTGRHRNPPEDAAAQITQHMLTALQGGSESPPETGMPPFSTSPIPFHPAGVINGEHARNIGDRACSCALTVRSGSGSQGVAAAV